MAKISYSYFLVLMLVVSVFSVVEKAKGDGSCTIIIDPKAPSCDIIQCRLSCITDYNGLAECIASKIGSPPNCVCTYDC
ncbi:putative defensin-like protein 154 [Arabidopsis thaliana]